MNVGRYLVGAVGFLLVWVGVIFIVGIALNIVFPPPGDVIAVGFFGDWRNQVGVTLGFFAGLSSFRASIRDPKKKEEKPDEEAREGPDEEA